MYAQMSNDSPRATGLDLFRRTRGPVESDRTWNDVGFRIALAGGIYPLILAVVVVVVAAALLQVAGPSLERSSYAILLEVSSLLGAGLPYLLFGSFLASALIAVPLVGLVAKRVQRTSVQFSPRRVTTIGVALIIGAWTIVLSVFGYLLLPH